MHSFPTLIFEVVRHHGGQFTAQCLNADIDTSGDNLEDLHQNLEAAVDQHYAGRPRPSSKDIHLLLYQE